MSISEINQYALALHTTTPQLGIAINNFAGNRRNQVWDLGRDLSSSLHQYLQEILVPQTWQDLKFIAVATGPGGFTGTRIGVVTARTLGQQLNIPVYGISTLAAIAHKNFPEIEPNSLIAVEMNTRREQLFVAIYQIASSGIWLDYLSDTTMNSEEWHKTLAEISQPYQLVKAPEKIADTVNNVLDLAYIKWQQKIATKWLEVIPFYGQKPF